MDARDKAQTAKTAAENARESAENSEVNAKTYKESAAESAATAQQYSGKPPKPENGTWWIWDAEKGAYVNHQHQLRADRPDWQRYPEYSVDAGQSYARLN